MSDRIDELVAAIDANTLLQWDGKDVALEAAHELATIARKAEAERDALRDALRWCGGSADFGPGGQAREGWQRKVAPLLAERVIRG